MVFWGLPVEKKKFGFWFLVCLFGWFCGLTSFKNCVLMFFGLLHAFCLWCFLHFEFNVVSLMAVFKIFIDGLFN